MFTFFSYAFIMCSARTGQNRVTWKIPSRAAIVPLQEPVAVLTSYVPHTNAGMKQYECGHTQPLFRAGLNHGQTSGQNLKDSDKY